MIHSEFSFKSFYMESWCFLFRNFTRAFIQGIGMLNYFWQLFFLSLSDLLVIILCLKFRNEFFNKIVFLCIFCYHCLLLTIDLCFLLNFKYSTVFRSINYDDFIFALVCSLIVTLLLFITCVSIVNLLAFFRSKSQ